jgi:hypothetical protein
MKKNMRIAAAILSALLLLGAVPALGDGPGGEYGVVISQNVSLRKDHSTGATRLRSLSNGERFDIVDRRDGWLYVAYTTKEGEEVLGWLLEEYVVENPLYITLRNSNTPAYAYPASGSKKVGSLSKYTRLTVIAQLERYWVVSLRQAAAAIPKSAAVWLEEDLQGWAAAPPREGEIIKRTTVRTGPGTRWASVKTLNPGAKVHILGMEEGWYVIQNEEAVAYVRGEDVGE